MFYWGRRGASTHYNYTVPPDADYEWFYSEVTVEKGDDKIGSYFMANGFAEGYFGMQVNSATERRMLFSVWAPFVTDKPEEVPEQLRVVRLVKDDEVEGEVFGEEGSGAQSYLRYGWKAGVAYKFLTRIRPTTGNNTLYSSWFFDPDRGQWRLLATYWRPETSTYYKRHYSFLECFEPHSGQFTSRGLYGNQWTRTKEGKWIEVTEAVFSVDATGNRGQRVDYQGGVADGKFYLKHNGFFNDPTPLSGTPFKRPATGKAPEIDLSALPHVDVEWHLTTKTSTGIKYRMGGEDEPGGSITSRNMVIISGGIGLLGLCLLLYTYMVRRRRRAK
jgi:hypothetical protein